MSGHYDENNILFVLSCRNAKERIEIEIQNKRDPGETNQVWIPKPNRHTVVIQLFFYS